MRYDRLAVAAAALMALMTGAGRVEAQTATQVVGFKVVPMNRVAIGTASASFTTQRAATNSAAPTSAMVAGSSYGITTNEKNQKIVASINAPLPAGTTLAVSLGAPAGAVSKGMKTLGTTAADVVTGITALTATELPITYALNARQPVTRVVTYTITSGM